MPDNRPHLFPAATEHHHDDARAERERLAERVIAALNDLANLDGEYAELAGIVYTEIRGKYPGPVANAGPEEPPPPPPHG